MDEADSAVRAVLSAIDQARTEAEGNDLRLAALKMLARRDNVIAADGFPARMSFVTLHWELVELSAESVQVQLRADDASVTLASLGPTSYGDAKFRAVAGDAGVVYVAQHPRNLKAIAAKLLACDATFPRSEAARLAANLRQTGMPLILPESLRGTPPVADETLVLRLSGTGDEVALAIEVCPFGLDGPLVYLAPGQGERELFGERFEVGQVWMRRDLLSETKRLQLVVAELQLPASDLPAWTLHGEQAIDLLEALQNPIAGTRVLWREAKQARRVVRATARDLTIEVAQKRDWFALSPRLALGEVVVDMAAVLAALRAGKQFVDADSSTLVRITDELRQRLRHLQSIGRQTKTGLEVAGLHASLLDGMVDLQGAPAKWRRSTRLPKPRRRLRQCQASCGRPCGLTRSSVGNGCSVCRSGRRAPCWPTTWAWARPSKRWRACWRGGGWVPLW